MTKRKALVTGASGQDGSYLMEQLLFRGYEVHGLVRRNSGNRYPNIDHLRGQIALHYGDVENEHHICSIINDIQPDEIYNLAAQSDVGISFECPEYTGDVTGLGTTRLLEAMRKFAPHARLYHASTSELFGSAPPPQNEKSTPMIPNSPYAAAKLYAHSMVRIYREAYGLFCCAGILMNHECLTAETPVIIRDKRTNLIRIEEIQELVPHRENPEKGKKYTTVNDCGFDVWDGQGWTQVLTRTATWNDVLSIGDKKVKLVNCRGAYYEATADHVSLLQDGQERPTKDLVVGDTLRLGDFPDLVAKTIVSNEEAELLGMLVADGYIRDGHTRFIKTDINLRNRVKELWQNVACGFSNDSTHPSGFNDSQVPAVELSGNPNYSKLIEKEIYTESRRKKIPTRILNSPIPTILVFLRAYNVCDGLKAGRQNSEFQCLTSNSQTLAAGLWYLAEKAIGLRITSHPEHRNGFSYFHLNANVPGATKGCHWRKPLDEIKGVQDKEYTGWLFDFETASGTFSAGIGHGWVHNSPRRGPNFVTRKITMAVAQIATGRQEILELGNLDAKRDWGFSPDYTQAMQMMLERDTPDEFVIGTGETHTVGEFAEYAFEIAGLDWKKHVRVNPKFYRPLEVNYLQADITKARDVLGWEPKTKFHQLVRIMVEHDMALVNRENEDNGRRIQRVEVRD